MSVTLNEFSSSYYLLNGIFILRNEYPTLARQISRAISGKRKKKKIHTQKKKRKKEGEKGKIK